MGRALLRAAAVALSSMVLVMSLQILAPGAAATQDQPSWGVGDRWVYRSTQHDNTTVTYSVDRDETLTIGATNYDTWHLVVNSTSYSSSYSFTFMVEEWLAKDGLGEVKEYSDIPFAGKTTSTWSPPQAQVVFPLNPGNTWSGTSAETTTSNFGTYHTTQEWSGLVMEESSLTVPAGTFTVSKVRSPATGAPYTIYYYSAAAGWFVQMENYDDNGVLSDVHQLTSYQYSPGFLGVSTIGWAAIGVGLALAMAVVVLALRRRNGTPPIPPQPPVMPGSP